MPRATAQTIYIVVTMSYTKKRNCCIICNNYLPIHHRETSWCLKHFVWSSIYLFSDYALSNLLLFKVHCNEHIVSSWWYHRWRHHQCSRVTCITQMTFTYFALRCTMLMTKSEYIFILNSDRKNTLCNTRNAGHQDVTVHSDFCCIALHVFFVSVLITVYFLSFLFCNSLIAFSRQSVIFTTMLSLHFLFSALDILPWQ